jgi:hypothetical protein
MRTWLAGSPSFPTAAAKKGGAGLPNTCALRPVACSWATTNGATSSEMQSGASQ